MDSGTLALIATIVIASVGGTWKIASILMKINSSITRIGDTVESHDETLEDLKGRVVILERKAA